MADIYGDESGEIRASDESSVCLVRNQVRLLTCRFPRVCSDDQAYYRISEFDASEEGLHNLVSFPFDPSLDILLRAFSLRDSASSIHRVFE